MSRLIRRLFDNTDSDLSSPKRVRRPIRRAVDVRIRLLCQGLEDRLVPATFHVTTLSDDAVTPPVGSLRAAINSANATSAADSIVFDLSGTVDLMAALPIVFNPVSITGTALDVNGLPQVNITRDVAAPTAFRIFDFAGIDGNSFSLTNLQISGGATTDSAAGIGIRENQSLTLTNSVVSGNSTSGPGGGIFVQNPGGNLTIRNSTIRDNTSGSHGGGVYFAAGGNLLMENSTVSGNSSGARAGGLYLYGSSTSAPGIFTVRNSTISGNTGGTGGGGIYFRLNGGNNSLLVQNSTIADNSAGGVGGGGIAQGTNTAGIITIQSSIVANNSATASPDLLNPAGAVAQVSNSLIRDTTGANITGPGNVTATDPLLNPLNSNGTSGQKTYSLQAGSPAIDTGSNPFGISKDETGAARGVGLTDMGAYEVQSTTRVTGIATAPDITAVGAGVYSFTVVYTAPSGQQVDSTTIAGSNVTVTGPGGPIAGITATSTATGPTVTATYSFTPPANPTAGWDQDDYGRYLIAVTGGVGTVTGGAAATVLPATVGGFSVILAKTYVVTNTNDTGPGSLRQAVLDANARTGTNDTIRFNGDPNVPIQSGAGITNFFDATPDVIPVTTGQMAINEGLTITGPGASLLTLQVNGPTATTTNRHFFIYAGGQITVNLSGMTLTGGMTGGTSPTVLPRGGSILMADEVLNITDCVITGNTATTRDAGAIQVQYYYGALNLLRTTVSNNRSAGAGGNGDGGAIGTRALSQLSIVNSAITGNTSNNRGGAIYIGDIGDNFIVNSTISGNSAAASGGGIYFYGGGLTYFTGLVIANTTITGNTAGTDGGAIKLLEVHGDSADPTVPAVLITNSTITANTALTSSVSGGGSPGGGGISKSGSYMNGLVVLTSSIVSGNSAAIAGAPQYYDISSDPTNTISGSFSAVGKYPNANNLAANFTDPSQHNLAADAVLNLKPLANNGGLTRTMALGVGSAALNAGTVSTDFPVTTDQRGKPRSTGGSPDIGAYEYQPLTIANIQLTDGVAADGTTQRSMVRNLIVTFTGDVTFTTGAATSLALTQIGGSAVGLSVVSQSVVQGQTVVTFRFTGAAATDPDSIMNGGLPSLANGRYQLTFANGAVTDTALGWNADGDGNGVPGGAYASPPDTNPAVAGQFKLYRLYGDANGDGFVDALDIGVGTTSLRTTLNRSSPDPLYLPYWDSNNDGSVDSIDLIKVRGTLNSNVFPP
jgi:hypothetical protein